MDIKHDINDVYIINERIVIFGWAVDVRQKKSPDISLFDAEGNEISSEVERT